MRTLYTTRYRLQVKCLHVHYAHWLATGSNLVGSWVQEALDNKVDEQAKTKTKGKGKGSVQSL